MKRVIFALIICLSVNLIITNAQQTDKKKQSSVSLKQSKFKKLFDIKDAIVVTEQYEIDDYNAKDFQAFANVGWLDGQPNKVYAANFQDIFIDFERLDNLQNDIQKIIQKIEKAISENKRISIRYISSDGIFINYYTFGTKGDLQRNVYFKMGNYLSQEKTTEQLKKISNLINQVREKLILLGAKRRKISRNEPKL